MCQALFFFRISEHAIPSGWNGHPLHDCRAYSNFPSKFSLTIASSRKLPFIFPNMYLFIYLSWLYLSSLGNFEEKITSWYFVYQHLALFPLVKASKMSLI